MCARARVCRDRVLYLPRARHWRTLAYTHIDGYHILLCDGANEHLELLKRLEDFDWWKSRQRVLVKLPANTTSKLQVCDLLPLFRNIKKPENALKKLNQDTYDLIVARMGRQWTKVNMGAKFFGEFTQVFALLFEIFMPMLTDAIVKAKWTQLGVLDGNLDRCLLQCDKSLSDDELELWGSKAKPAIIQITREGRLTRAYLTSLGLPVEELDPDGKADKSQFAMILTCDGQRDVVLAKHAAEVLANAAAAERKVVREAKAEEKKLTWTSAAPARGSKKRKACTDTVISKLRQESVGVAGETCPLCGVSKTVMEAYSSEYATKMFKCTICERYLCGFCAPSMESLQRMHAPLCRVLASMDAKIRVSFSRTCGYVVQEEKEKEQEKEAEDVAMGEDGESDGEEEEADEEE